ncbi:MAG: hypothetical protein GY841_17605 [FCB group bacterium]|nr:hypothetical protein [FCB group bacterium]
MTNNQKPPKGITLVILALWALLCVRCEEREPCSEDDALRCAECTPGDEHSNCLEHCVNGEWEIMMNCKALIGDDAMCQDRHDVEAECIIIGG